MFDSDATLFLVAACGLILLRPSDVPLIARYAGRAAGLGVRGLRGLRDATDAAMKEGESVMKKHGGSGMGKDLRESFSKFDSLRTTLTRDIARFAPFERLHGTMASTMQLNAQTPVLNKKNNTTDAGLSQSTTTTPNLLKTIEQRKGIGPGNQSAGVDIIARSIEEAALARQQQRILGRTHLVQNQSENETQSNDLDPRGRG